MKTYLVILFSLPLVAQELSIKEQYKQVFRPLTHRLLTEQELNNLFQRLPAVTAENSKKEFDSVFKLLELNEQ